MTSLLLLLISSFFFFPHFSYCQSSFSFCSFSNYTHGSRFEYNLNQLLAILPQKASQNGGSYDGSFGTSTTRVYGRAMCFADSNATACNDCLNQAYLLNRLGTIEVCPMSTTVDIMYESCVIRYSEQNFTHNEIIGILSCVSHMSDAKLDPITDPKRFKVTLQQFMHDLTRNASLLPLKLAAGIVKYTPKQTIYGIAQCARESEPDHCVKCMNETVAFMGNCSHQSTVRGGAVTSPSCFMRYEFHPFYVINEARPPWKNNGGGKHEISHKNLLFTLVFFIPALLLL